MLPLPKFRELVFQLLYSYDMGHAEQEDMTVLMMNELSVGRQAVLSAQARIDQIIAKKEDLDLYIKNASHSYEFDRIQAVERNILRLAIYELFYDNTIPPKVTIAEAMRLARKFSTPEAATFINAILDQLYKQIQTKDQSVD